MPEPAELADALLGADAAERARVLGETDAATLEVTIKLLGHRHTADAAELLALIDASSSDRALRKAARRELHRLESAGIAIPSAPTAVAVDAPAQSTAQLPVAEAWATEIDGSGARALWVLGLPPLGGAWFGALLINDLEGLLELSLVDTTRKRYLRELEEQRVSTGTWVRLPGDYAWRLIREAVDVSHERGAALPTRYRAFRDVFGEAPGPPERPLVFETVNPVEASFNPELLEQAGALLREPELRGWYVPVADTFKARALEAARAPGATLLVPGQEPEAQALHLVAEAGRQALTPPVVRALRRRLEETGYLFVVSDRLLAARRAVAVSRALDDSRVSADHNPLLRLLLTAGLARLIRGERIGGVHSAAESLVELIERAADQQSREGAGHVESRPSGLILPR
jgi:hypothetical protein